MGIMYPLPREANVTVLGPKMDGFGVVAGGDGDDDEHTRCQHHAQHESSISAVQQQHQHTMYMPRTHDAAYVTATDSRQMSTFPCTSRIVIQIVVLGVGGS